MTGGSSAPRPAHPGRRPLGLRQVLPDGAPGRVLRRRGGRPALAAGGRRGGRARGDRRRCPTCWRSSGSSRRRADAGGWPSGSAGSWPRLHRAGADAFGAPLAGLHRRADRGQHAVARPVAGLVRRAAAPAVPAALGRQRRARAGRRRAGRAGDFADSGVRRDEPPARIHGDLWPGNVLWGPTTGSGWSTRRRTAGTGRPTWPSSRSSAACRMRTGCWPPTRRPGRSPTAGASGCPAAPAAPAARAHGAVRHVVPRIRSLVRRAAQIGPDAR